MRHQQPAALREKREEAQTAVLRERKRYKREAEWNLEVIRSSGSHHMWRVGRIDGKFCSVRPIVKTTSGCMLVDSSTKWLAFREAPRRKNTDRRLLSQHAD